MLSRVRYGPFKSFPLSARAPGGLKKCSLIFVFLQRFYPHVLWLHSPLNDGLFRIDPSVIRLFQILCAFVSSVILSKLGLLSVHRSYEFSSIARFSFARSFYYYHTTSSAISQQFDLLKDLALSIFSSATATRMQYFAHDKIFFQAYSASVLNGINSLSLTQSIPSTPCVFPQNVCMEKPVDYFKRTVRLSAIVVEDSQFRPTTTSRQFLSRLFDLNFLRPLTSTHGHGAK